MLENGDIKRGNTGSAVIISGTDAEVQRVLICASAVKGGFVYDRSLGSDYEFDMDEAQAESVINEALAGFENTYARVLESGDTLRLGIETPGGLVEKEVIFYGKV